ncbi:MAG TPA: cytochrome b/b6 domain-containing protein, partial [Ramlibacter sp.]|nr:cytochrome b/b6 domain-containing protein [Ramlibacter sp.]
MPTVATDRVLGAFVPATTARVPARADASAIAMVRVRVWDLPTRMFHWALVASLAGLVATGYAGGAWIDWHARIGSLVLALLLFRVVWGFAGGRWSRFASFVPTPARLRAYLGGRATPEQEAGHSPLGALSVLAMLTVLFAQLATGLVSDDGGGFTGPLNAWVSSALGDLATQLHKNYGQWVLLGLVLLHVLAIAFYR